MIFDKIYRIIWGILFIVLFPATIIYKNEMKFTLIFISCSCILFILDFIKINRLSKRATYHLTLRRRWHIFANFTQWLFWSAIVALPFNPAFDLKYKIFVFFDLFIISTFTFYKFSRLNQK